MASVDRVAADCTGMQGKQASLLAQHSEDGPQQVGAHIEGQRPPIRVYNDLLPIGNQVAANSMNAQEVSAMGWRSNRDRSQRRQANDWEHLPVEW